jgi:uridine phosphorylase
VRAGALVLRQAIEAAREPAALVGVLERVQAAVARNAAMELANLKRVYKIAGFSEANIHTVIPDRSRRSAPTKPAPQDGGAQGSPSPKPAPQADSA